MNSSVDNRHRRILVIDDNRAIHDDFRKILAAPDEVDAALQEAEAKIFGTRQTVSFEIEAAAQGEEGLQMVQRALTEGRPYSMAFVDVRMPPGWDGIETTKRIWEVCPDLQIVICTAYAECSWSEMQEEMNPRDRLLILKKPFDSIEVLQLANALTEKWRLQQESKTKLDDLERMVGQRTQELEESRNAALIAMENAVRSKEGLRESEERHRQLVELSPDGIVVHLEGKIVFANRAAAGLFRVKSAAEMVGWTVLERVDPLSRDLAQSRMSQLREAHEALPVVEETLLHLDGSTFQAEVISAPFTHERKPAGLSIFRDITEKKSLQEKLLRNQRLESIGTLAGGIAHDLNNVLAPILMSLEILGMKLTDEQDRRLLSALEASAQRGADLVKQVLTFARGMQGEKTLLNVGHIVREMRTIVQQTFPKSVQLSIDLPRDLWTMEADATQIHQVLMNLCVNARDAMPHGGRLTISGENSTLDEAFARMNPEARVGPYVVLTVTDTGTGMPPGVRERIFEPFFTTKEIGRGTGLGLATVRGIVTGHGGFVTVYSEMGRGTRFKVYLPANLSPEMEKNASESAALPKGQGELILVVDDETAIQEIAKQTLAALGYQALTAGDGAAAVAICAQRVSTLKLVLTDMMMPIMDGPATIRALRLISPGLKIIASSGLDAEARETDPRKLGVNAFLRKPFTAETLARTVHRVLGEIE